MIFTDTMTPNDDVSDHCPSRTDSEDGSHWSPPGSIRHPYRSLMENTIFPRCHQLATSRQGPETYTRSLSMLGHGMPLWNPLGSQSVRRKKKHLKTGVNIGDVGYLNPNEGHFEYFFNIFCDATDDIQVACPHDFIPLSSPLPENIIKNETYFPPGTALVSKGVSTLQHSVSPLDIEFTIDARESGILILPNGASREDLISTDLVREFVRKNALAWYMFINKYSDPLCPNGNLYVVTGCDRTATYALATSSVTSLHILENSPNIRFQDGRWQGDEYYLVDTIMSNASRHTGPCAVILRGMQVALNTADWINYVFRNEPPLKLSFYHILKVTVTGRRARWRTKLEECIQITEKHSNGQSRCILFNPSMVILQYLLQQSPQARVAITEDGLWSLRTGKSDGTVQQVVQILRKLLEEYEVFEENGLTTLVPLQDDLQNLSKATRRSRNLLFRGFKLVREEIQIKLRRWAIARKLAKVFPGQGLPHGMLVKQ